MQIQNSVLERVYGADIIGGVFNIPASVKSIGHCAFYDCSGLTSLVIPESVTSIKYGAFDGCSGLTSIIIPKAVKSIGDWAFCRCTGLPPYADKSKIVDIALGLLPHHNGLCLCLDKATRIVSMKTKKAINVQSTFPNFRREIAVEKFGGREESYWWPIEDKASRISFLEWLRNN